MCSALPEVRLTACSVIHQCPEVSPISAQQCRLSVLPSSATCQCPAVSPISAAHQCLQLVLSVSAAYQCPSLLHISASSVPPHQCPPV
ncbi:unnamed protein product, partial [Staurois parvus]